MQRYGVMVLMCIVMSGCMSPFNNNTLVTDVSIRKLPLAHGAYEQLAWLDNQTLVTQVTTVDGRDDSAVRLASFTLTDTSVQVLDLPLHPECQETTFYSMIMRPVTLPSNKVAYLVRCMLSLAGGENNYLMVYDGETSVPLRDSELDPITAVNAKGNIHTYTFFPSMKTGFVVDSWKGESQLHSFDQAQVVRVDLGVAVVGTAQLSPDGTQLLITTQETSDGTLDMLDRPYSIEFVDPVTFQRRPLFNGYSAHSITWSPTSNYVGIVASSALGAQDSIWLINAETGGYTNLGSGNINSIAWSPGGDKLAVNRFLGEKKIGETLDREIVILDLATVEFP